MVLNLHLDAFPNDSDVMARQVSQLDAVLTHLDKKSLLFVAGGDFNLLPPGQRLRLPSNEAAGYRQDTEIAPLYEKYQVVPSLTDVNGPMCSTWFTHFPNTPGVTGPDRTIDYLVLSPRPRLLEARVRQHDTQKISDHLPVVAVLQLH